MTIAITPFDGLCGFRPLKEISHFLSTVPSLRRLVGESAAKEFESAINGHETSDSPEDMQKYKKALQTAFSALVNQEKSTVASAAKNLVASAQNDGEKFAGSGGPANEGKELADLVVRLNSQFEGDIGLFVLFFLNYVKLEVGEAMFLKADDIHAYLSGGERKLLNPTDLNFPENLSPSSFPPLDLSLTHQPRHHRMHGLLGQRRPRRLHPQIPRHPHPNHHAHLLVRAHLGAKNAPGRLPLRHPQQPRLLLLLQRDPLRSADRGVQRCQDGAEQGGREGYV